MIEVENLSKRYGAKLAVGGLDFVVRPGVVTGFLGPNGAGKSTTMRMIAGLDEPTTGRVKVNGRDYRAALVPNALSPWTGFVLLCGYAAIVIAAGAWRLRRSDA